MEWNKDPAYSNKPYKRESKLIARGINPYAGEEDFGELDVSPKGGLENRVGRSDQSDYSGRNIVKYLVFMDMAEEAGVNADNCRGYPIAMERLLKGSFSKFRSGGSQDLEKWDPTLMQLTKLFSSMYTYSKGVVDKYNGSD